MGCERSVIPMGIAYNCSFVAPEFCTTRAKEQWNGFWAKCKLDCNNKCTMAHVQGDCRKIKTSVKFSDKERKLPVTGSMRRRRIIPLKKRKVKTPMPSTT